MSRNQSTSVTVMLSLGTLSTMENLYYEVLLEHLFGMPYAQILRGTQEETGATESDLLQMGHRIYLDLVRMRRSAGREISRVSIPSRFPFPGEYVPSQAA